MGLDITTLRLAYAAVAILLLVLFFSAYRGTRSRLSLCWTVALACQVGGATLYVLVDLPVGAIAVPLGDLLIALGLVWALEGARSLRNLRLPRWIFFVLPPVVALVTVVQELVGEQEPGAVARYVTGFAVTAMSIWEIQHADARHRRVKRPLLVASVILTVFFGIRVIELLADPAATSPLAAVATDTTTTFVLILTLVMVSFSIAALSHSDAEEQLRSRERLSALELSQGAQVQQALLPFHRLEGVQYPVSGACVPSKSLSGDFFDWNADDDHLVITVGDVMGKGVGAAMLGATVRAGLRAVRSGGPGTDVEKVMETLGDDLVRNGSFVTLFHAYLDRASSTLTVLDAGHGLALIARHDGTRERISSVNLPLGLGLENEWAVRTFELGPGDRLLVFSDGVLELFDGSLDSLLLAADIALAPGLTTMDEAVDRIREIADAGAHDDDVTVVALERPLAPAREHLIQ